MWNVKQTCQGRQQISRALALLERLDVCEKSQREILDVNPPFDAINGNREDCHYIAPLNGHVPCRAIVTVPRPAAGTLGLYLLVKSPVTMTLPF